MLLLILVLLLGLVQPTSSDDALLAMTLFAFVSFIVLRPMLSSWWFWFVILSLNGYISWLFSRLAIFEFSYTALLVCIFLGITFAVIVLVLPNRKKFIIIPILIIFILTSFINSVSLRQLLAENPQSESYTTDMMMFLKTFYRMENQSYYRAYQDAYRGHMEYPANSSPQGIWGWRLPSVFYLWRLPGINNGGVIFWEFLLLTILLLGISYHELYSFLPKHLQHLAILSPYLLQTYVHLPLRNWTVLQTEWWSAIPLAIGVLFLLNKRVGWSVLFFTLAIFIREMSLIPVLLLIVLSQFYIQKKQERLLMIVPIVLFSLFMALHYQQTSQFITTGLSGFSLRLHGGWDLVKNSLEFGGHEYLFLSVQPILYLILITVLGIIIKPTHTTIYYLCFYILLLSFTIIGTSEWNNVWGVLYVLPLLPALPLSLAAIFGLLNKRTYVNRY